MIDERENNAVLVHDNHKMQSLKKSTMEKKNPKASKKILKN